MSKLVPIPQPPMLPIIGNLKQMDGNAVTFSLMDLADDHGPFFKMNILGQEFYLASSYEIVNELSDPTRFEKDVSGPLEAFREFAGDGLFTAYNDELNWGKAHRILMPAFGPIGVRDMFDQMLDIAMQMFVRWERFGPETPIDVAEDMTRLTLDTIALCGFGYRFNSFYQDELHPFVDAMVGSLVEGAARLRRPRFVNSIMRKTTQTYYDNIEIMRSTGQELIDKRRAEPPTDGFPDLLSRMLYAKDPVTGEVLDDDNIIYQMVTFLIAGHETTSSTLTFAVNFLLRNPEVLKKARAVVDEVIGTQTPRVEHLQHLRYIEQILMETLRHWPPAPAYTVHPIKKTVLGGKYEVNSEDSISVLIRRMHMDKAVWGDDPERFNPDNFAPENAEKLPPNAWKPFGNGARACIGRPFAMQEAQLVLSMMLQRFDFEFDDPSYELQVLETSAMKPTNLNIRVTPRRPMSAYAGQTSFAPEKTSASVSCASYDEAANDKSGIPLTIAYGSNAGSSETLARRLATQASHYGFYPAVFAMDELVDKLEDIKLLTIVTASYEGEPPDNAAKFVPHLEALPPEALQYMTYAVFGCGNRQWARTYQAIPKRVDAALAAAGATRGTGLGVGDSGGNFFGAFEDWTAQYWEKACEQFNLPKPEPLNVTPVRLSFSPDDKASTLDLRGFKSGTVIENKCLVDMDFDFARAKHHIELKLPDGMSYQAGDYLGVLASNSPEQTQRVMRRFGLTPDTIIILEDGQRGFPIKRPISCAELIANYVELAEPATCSHVKRLADTTACPPEKQALESLAGDKYQTQISALRVSVLDLLEEYSSCQLSFEDFLGMLPVMRMRQYSISSSALWKADHVTLTLAVLDRPALSGRGDHKGVASNFLANLQAKDRLYLKVIPGPKHFRLPEDISVPVIMACAGSGIAPFRGFIEERALQKKAGTDTGPIHLYFGVDHPDCDLLYKNEFKRWQRDGVIKPYFAYSEKPDGDIKFVQHRLWAQRKQVWDMMEKGAYFYTCGDGEFMEPAVRQTLIEIYAQKRENTLEDAKTWFASLEDSHRYTADVFS